MVSLASLKGQWVVLYFYPRDDTPGCITEVCEFTAGIAAFRKFDAVIIGGSRDSPDIHRRLYRKTQTEDHPTI